MDTEGSISTIKALYIRDSEVRQVEFKSFLSMCQGLLQSSSDTNQNLFRTKYEKTIIRLAVECPLLDIRSASEEFLQANRISYDPRIVEAISAFIPAYDVKPLNGQGTCRSDEEKSLYLSTIQELFFTFGRVGHIDRIMGAFPEYMQNHFDLIKELLFESGPLQVDWRIYIAYMASAAHKCDYLMSACEEQGKLYGSKASWFTSQGFSEIPGKIRDLGTVNIKLAHRPWDLDENDIQSLLGNWQISELCHALVILCVFHSLSSLALGLGICPEYDLIRHNRRASVSDELGEDEDDYDRTAGGYLTYIHYDIIAHRRPVRPSDFNWNDQGFNIIEKCLPGIAEKLMNRIRYTFVMTFDSMGGEEGQNTANLRRAIWMYTQRVYGLEYDDYDYGNVNGHIKRQTKTYIKEVACVPHRVTRRHIDLLDMKLVSEDIIHINFLVCEARLETELIYTTNAVQAFI
ncbi:unnamed protein product [Blepharisma stoltei]|uniref:Uncharacterized protein n=1 Tax=Blepharisma stoltei TaxID=1481888 RepID=A0AAU9IXM8_9CILI|nr:unnamed protein product [Blepharisma stoltei]